MIAKLFKLFKTKKSALKDLNERKPLPVGVTEFNDWASRIINLTNLPQVDPEGMAFALATMVLHLGPTESHKEDAYFVHSLRKSASNQIAHAMMVDLKAKATARFKASEVPETIIPVKAPLSVVADQAPKPSEVTPNSGAPSEAKVLGNKQV